MPTRYIKVAVNDGNGNQTATPGISKWVRGTIPGVYPADFTPVQFNWASMCTFLLLKVQKDDIGPNVLENINKRKYKISFTKLKQQFGWSDAQVQKYRDNYTIFAVGFRNDQQTMPYKEAVAKWKALWKASGIPPIFTKTLDLDEVDVIEPTPEWQWVPDPIVPD